jgi:death-on-curing protein
VTGRHDDEVEYLDLEDLLGLTRALHAGPVRGLGLLDAACARTRSTAFGTDAYPTLKVKAAALWHSLARNHVLVDGNKRLAWLGTLSRSVLSARFTGSSSTSALPRSWLSESLPARHRSAEMVDAG